MKILLLAYAISPSRGSEPATGWGWASSLATAHDVTVIAYPRYKDEVDSYLNARREPHLTFCWVSPQSGSAPPYRSPFQDQLNYLRWLRLAARKCRQLLDEQSFDVVHLVSFASVNAPIPLRGLRVPFLLGPVGGGQRLKWNFQSALGPMPLSEKLRNIRVFLLPYRASIRQTIRRSKLVLVTNRETDELVRRCGGKTLTFADSGIAKANIAKYPKKTPLGEGLRILWVGTMLYWKGLPLALHALKVAGRKDFVLDVLGSGPMEQHHKLLAKRLGIADQVVFHGHVPFSQVFNHYDRSDLFVFPSVREAFGSQLLEAASRGLPILTLDHQGAGTLLPDSVAWKVPVTTAEETIRGLAEAMLELARSPDRLASMSRAALKYAQTESWPERVRRINEIYEHVISGADSSRSLNERDLVHESSC